jgi:c-di-GMP-binding flagellar brake protein YcgR
MGKVLEEKRKYLRLNNALEIEFAAPDSDKRYTATTKDISAVGIKFSTPQRLSEGSSLDITMKLPNSQSAVHASGRVAWLKKGPDDKAFDVGIEFLVIEEDNKNTFLKYLCDLIYG